MSRRWACTMLSAWVPCCLEFGLAQTSVYAIQQCYHHSCFCTQHCSTLAINQNLLYTAGLIRTLKELPSAEAIALRAEVRHQCFWCVNQDAMLHRTCICSMCGSPQTVQQWRAWPDAGGSQVDGSKSRKSSSWEADSWYHQARPVMSIISVQLTVNRHCVLCSKACSQ